MRKMSTTLAYFHRYGLLPAWCFDVISNAAQTFCYEKDAEDGTHVYIVIKFFFWSHIWMLGTLSEKNGIMWGKFPKEGGGVWPKPTPYFSLFFPIQGLIKWQKKRRKKCENSQTGGRGSATWEFFPHNPFLTTTLILIKRNVMVELFILGKDGHQVIWCN